MTFNQWWESNKMKSKFLHVEEDVAEAIWEAAFTAGYVKVTASIEEKTSAFYRKRDYDEGY